MQQLQADFNRLCQPLYPNGTPPVLQTTPGHDGTTHIEIHGNQYHYLATDRGVEVMHQITSDINEMLYWLVRDVTWGKAVGYEFRHRIPGQSFRRLLFAKYLEYMAQVDSVWTERLRQEIDAILAKHPYDDEREG